MLVKKDTSRIYSISAVLTKEQYAEAKSYIKTAVAEFCKNNPGQTFSVRELFGGANRDWNGTPLQPIYNYHNQPNVNAPADKARKDVGKLLKSILENDQNAYYERMQGGKTKLYRKIN